MPRGDQLARQWRLLQCLGRPSGLAVEDAARELGCTVRTVWRDLRVLQEAGFPIYDDRDGRRSLWKVEEAFRARLPIPLALDEIVALLVSRDLLEPGGTGAFGPAVVSAFAKLRALLTPRALALVERMGAAVGARTVGAKLQLGAAEHLEALQRALAEGRTVRMRYYSLSRDAESDRAVDPYHLTYFNGGLYLVGHCHLRREVRIFAVDRIRNLTATGEAFVRPPDFDAGRYLRGAWGIVRGDLVAVRAVFSPSAAPHVRGRLWHASQEFRELEGGRLELRLTVADTLEVRRWLLGFGAEVEVLAPSSLRDAIRLEAERLVASLSPLPDAPPVRKGPARAGARASARPGGVAPGPRTRRPRIGASPDDAPHRISRPEQVARGR